MEFINEAILHAAGQWWIYPILTIFCFIDGFIPILPSETLIVALGALSVTSGEPNMWFVMAAAALGAIAGDNMAYLLGLARRGRALPLDAQTQSPTGTELGSL
ncbi:hypothetical protein ACOM2C_17755 [Pseudarthrobacter sp. So.54]